MPLGVSAWLATAAGLNEGRLDLETTGQDMPMLAGMSPGWARLVFSCSA